MFLVIVNAEEALTSLVDHPETSRRGLGLCAQAGNGMEPPVGSMPCLRSLAGASETFGKQGEVKLECAHFDKAVPTSSLSHTVDKAVVASNETTVPSEGMVTLDPHRVLEDDKAEASGSSEEEEFAVTPAKTHAAVVLEQESPLSAEKEPLPSKQDKRGRKRGPQKALLNKGQAEAKLLGVDFHTVFQPGHNYKLKRDHWANFQLALARGEADKLAAECSHCEAILAVANKRTQTSSQTEGSQLQEGGLPPPLDRNQVLVTLEQEEGIHKPARGRRPRDRIPLLTDNAHRWLEIRRQGMYTFVEDGKLRCNSCTTKFKCSRTNTVRSVLQHEAHRSHQAMSDYKVCRGKAIDKDQGEKAILSEWLQLGAPWSSPAIRQKCYFHDKAEVPVLWAAACAAEGNRIGKKISHCSQCEQLSRRNIFWKKVSNWIVRAKLVDFLRARFLEDAAAQDSIIKALTTGYCTKVAELQVDLPTLTQLPHDKCYRLVEKLIITVPKHCRNASADSWIEQQFSWIPRLCPDMEGDQKRALIAHSRFLAGSRGCQAETNLAEKILKGALRADSVVKVLVAGLVHKGWRMQRDAEKASVQKTASSFHGVDEASLHEAAFALSACHSTKRFAEMVGLNLYRLPRVPYDVEDLPQPLGASMKMAATNCSIALDLMGSKATRDWMLSFHETVYFPQYCLVNLA